MANIKRNLRQKAKLFVKSANNLPNSLGERTIVLQFVRFIGVDIIFDGSSETEQTNWKLTRHTRKCVTYLNHQDPITNNHVIEFGTADKWEVIDVGLDNQNQRQYLTLNEYGK